VNDDQKVPRLLTTKQVAELTNIPTWRLLQLVKQRPDKRSKKRKPLPPAPPHVWIGRTLLFPEDGIGPWIRALTTAVCAKQEG
jgi:hypothetical protein